MADAHGHLACDIQVHVGHIRFEFLEGMDFPRNCGVLEDRDLALERGRHDAGVCWAGSANARIHCIVQRAGAYSLPMIGRSGSKDLEPKVIGCGMKDVPGQASAGSHKGTAVVVQGTTIAKHGSMLRSGVYIWKVMVARVIGLVGVCGVSLFCSAQYWATKATGLGNERFTDVCSGPGDVLFSTGEFGPGSTVAGPRYPDRRDGAPWPRGTSHHATETA